MRNKKKICALIILMMMGAFTVAQNSVYAKEEETTVVESQVEQKEIKGNKDALETAQDLINKKDFQGALAYLDAYISAKQKKYEGYKLRGEAYYALRRYDLAAKDFQTAIDLKTVDDKFMTGTKVLGAVVLGADKQEQLQNPELGNLYARLMYAQKALNNPAYETSYAKAVEYNSHIYLPQPKKNQISQINCPQKYGKDFNPQGDDKFLYGAIEDIEKENYRDSIFKSQYIISTYPDYYLGYYLNGVALSALEQDEDAIVAFKSALYKNSYDFESLASLGQIYYSRAEKTFSVDDAKKSNEYFQKALKFNPNCNTYYFYIGLNELQLGNIDVSIDNFNRAIRLKPNDYNSLYYKLIAQYIKGDYASVVEGSTKLLYKNVSNYNSVLYLRALAYYKTNSDDFALQDLEKIYNNTNDIYNSDIRYVSDKEKTLTSYVYYLKAKILNKQGLGAKSDSARAYQNPIIAKLAGVEQVIKPYQAPMNGDTITLDDYNNFNKAYKAVPELLQSNFVITVDDIDTQYDYIRTTFDDLGVSFVYKNPYYQMTVIDNYVAKKYSSKLAIQDMSGVSESTGLVLRPRDEEKPVLSAHTPQAEMIAPDNSTSIAQMLASQSLIPEPKLIVEETPAEVIEQKDEVIASVPEADVKPIENVESVAEEVLPEKVSEEVMDEAPADVIAERPSVVENVKTVVDEVKADSQIVEKHADVNPSEYGVASAKPMPVVDNPEEVVELPQSYIFKAHEQMAVDSFDIKYPVAITDDFSGTKLSENQESLPVSEDENSELDERILLPEPQEDVSNSQVSAPVGSKDTSVAVPVVLVPEIVTPIVQNIAKAEDAVQKIIEEVQPLEQEFDVPQVIDIQDPEGIQVLTDAENSSDAEKPAKSAKVKKEKVKKQKNEKEEAEKPVKIKKEKPVKELVEKPVKEKKATPKKEKIKKVKEPKVKKQKTEKKKVSEVSNQEEVNVNTLEKATVADNEQAKKKKKRFHWWSKKNSSKEQNHTSALSKLFEKQSGDIGEVYVKNDKDKKIIKSIENK